MTVYRKIDVEGMLAVEPMSQPAPQLLWVDIKALVIDDRYQRPLSASNITAIRRIAGEFRWSRFSPVLVAPVEGGKYALIDGQHRAHAAALCGFERIPAMVTLVASEEQALAFIQINTRQIRVSTQSVYRAALTAGEDWAIRCQRAVAAADCRLMSMNYTTKDKKPGMVFTIALIHRLIDRNKDQAVTKGLTALRQYEPESVANFSDALLTPWLSAVSDNMSEVADLVTVLKSRRPWLVLDEADRLAGETGKPKAVCRRDAFALMIKDSVGCR